MEQNFTELLINRRKNHRNRNNSSKSLQQSNSDTNYVLFKKKVLREEIEEDIRSKSKKKYKTITHDHKHTSHCKYCKGFQKLLKKERRALSTYIQDNSNFLKLLGNQRYTENSPFLFVEDYKNKISEKKMGLMPIPIKKSRTKSVKNKEKLYNLQREIVMVRRYQYGLKNIFSPTIPSSTYDVALIQQWWKNMYKIILIQKYFRGYFIRKQVNSINNLHKFMNKFEQVIIKLKKEKFIYNILLKSTIKKRRKPIKGNYLTKQKNLINNALLDKVIIIQKNFRKFKAKIIYKKLLREQKFIIANKNKSFISKKNYNIEGIYDKIIMIQFNTRKYLISKKYFSYKNFHNKNIGAYNISKNYIDIYSMKIIKFYNLMLHGLRLLAMKKIRSNYKYIYEYNKDDINKVIFIQRFYLRRYYNKHAKKLKRKKIKKIGIVDKLRLKENMHQIKLIQNMYRMHYLKRNKYNKKVVKNKPIFSSPMKKSKYSKINIKQINNWNNNINNINNSYNKKRKFNNNINYKLKYNNYNNNKNKSKENIDENNYQTNGRLINDICFYTKEYKINQMNEILFLQTKIYSFLFFKNLRKPRKKINKKDFNCNFLITKANTNENICIEKIKTIQKIYKVQLNNMKNNIIENFNSKNSNSIENESNNNNDKNNKNKRKNPKNQKLIPKSPLKGYTYPIQNSPFSTNNNNNKYYTRYKNDNYNFSFQKENSTDKKLKKTLRDKLNKNKTPRKDVKGNYISKKRVEKFSEENYLTFNKKIFHQINKNQCYFEKLRLNDNTPEIKKLQYFWRKISNYNNIIKRPLNINNKNFDTLNKKYKENYLANKIKNKKNKKIPSIKHNSNKKSLFYNNSNIFISQYDNDEYSDKNSEISNNINDNSNNKTQYCYIKKIRKRNLLNYILLLQKNIRNFIKKKIYIKRPYIDLNFISKYNLDNITYNKYIKHIEESKTIIKLEKNNYNSNSINSHNIFLITKSRYLNFIPDIETIQRNWRLNLSRKIKYKKLKPRMNYISKNRIKNNDQEITMIQNIVRKRIYIKNKTISRKIITSKALYNKRRYSKNKNNNKIIDNKGSKSKSKNKIIKKLNQNMENYLNRNKLNNLSKNQENNSSYTSDNYSSNSNSNSVKSFSKKEFSNAKTNYISKIYKYIIYKKQVNNVGNFMSKEFKVEIKKKKDFSFLKLLCLFITKNTQEYIFYLLKYNTEKTFLYPFYINTLNRILKYLRSSKNEFDIINSSLNQEENNTGKKIKKLFLKIFPSLYIKNPYQILSSLNSEIQEVLVNTNIYNSIEPDFINFINDFTKYDKLLSNNIFIETRLKNTKLINTNIFSIIKFIDNEYSFLIYGKYCSKCFLDKNKCSCEIKQNNINNNNNNNNINEYYYSDKDNILDIEFDPYYFNKNKEEYYSTKWKDISIKRKPKIEEAYEDPITHIIQRTKEKQKLNRENKFNSLNNNTNDSFYGTNANSSNNSKILNKIKNDLNDNSLNNSKNISKIKAIYHQNNNTKKENLILIKNNDY